MNRQVFVAIAAVLVAAGCTSSASEPATTVPQSTTSTAGTMDSTTTSTAPTTTATAPPSTTTSAPEVSMVITSPEFEQGESIPTRFSCDGENVSPGLTLANVPSATVSLALIMDDPDAPAGTWIHWVAFDFPPTEAIPEAIPLLGIGGINSFGTTVYGGPCPPTGTHRYFFKIYALDTAVELPQGASKEDLLTAMEGHILDQAELMGRYTR